MRLKHKQSHIDKLRTERQVHVFCFHRYLHCCIGDLGREVCMIVLWHDVDVIKKNAKHKNFQVQRLSFLQETATIELLSLLLNSSENRVCLNIQIKVQVIVHRSQKSKQHRDVASEKTWVDFYLAIILIQFKKTQIVARTPAGHWRNRKFMNRGCGWLGFLHYNPFLCLCFRETICSSLCVKSR